MDFQKKYNCARIALQTGHVNFVRMNEDDFEFMVSSPEVLILNSRRQSEYGKLSDVELILKVPRTVQ